MGNKGEYQYYERRRNALSKKHPTINGMESPKKQDSEIPFYSIIFTE
ncbi:hypothetical protein V7122_20660 [Bacillus sp. JJ1532]